MALLMGYEKLFNRLNHSIKEDRKFRRYAKRKIFYQCLFDLKKLDKAANMNLFNLMQIKSRQDVQEMVKTYKEKM